MPKKASTDSPNTSDTAFAMSDKTRDELPTNDEPMIANVVPDDTFNTFAKRPEAEPVTNFILPPQPVEEKRTIDGREVFESDYNSVGYKSLLPQAQANFHRLVFRPGDTIGAQAECYPLNDVSLKARVVFMPGSVVPGNAKGYVLTNYIDELARLRYAKD